MPNDKTESKSLRLLDKYVSVLVDAYPEPIRATELAGRAGLSKPAVTKVRDRLMQLCNPKAMAFDKGFVLFEDEKVLGKLFQIFAANGRHRQFLQSKFVRAFIASRPIHSIILARFPLYKKYFNEQDTKFLVNLVMETASRLDPFDLQDLIKSIEKKGSVISGYNISVNMQKVINDLQFSIRNEEELHMILQLRDKCFFLIRDYLWAAIESMKMLKQLESEDRSAYVSVYKHTADFYLRELFQSFNDPIISAAKSSSIKTTGLKLDIGATLLATG